MRSDIAIPRRGLLGVTCAWSRTIVRFSTRAAWVLWHCMRRANVYGNSRLREPVAVACAKHDHPALSCSRATAEVVADQHRREPLLRQTLGLRSDVSHRGLRLAYPVVSAVAQVEGGSLCAGRGVLALHQLGVVRRPPFSLRVRRLVVSGLGPARVGAVPRAIEHIYTVFWLGSPKGHSNPAPSIGVHRPDGLRKRAGA